MRIDNISDVRWPMVAVADIGRYGNIAVLTTAAELQELYALRFRRYVEEQGKKYGGQQVNLGLLTDGLDAPSLNIAQLQSGGILAAVRLSVVSDIEPDHYLSPLRAIVEPTLGPRCMVCSRLVSTENRSGLRSIISLFRATYAIGLHHGGTHCAITTREDLRPVFEAFGYTFTGQSFEHPISGIQFVMVLEMTDYGRLERISSPLLPTARHYLHHQGRP